MPSKPVLAARSIMDTSCIIGVPITSSTKSPNTTSTPQDYLVLKRDTIRSQMAAATPDLGITGKSSIAPFA